MKLREPAKEYLKSMAIEEIQKHIEEFVLFILGDEPIATIRLFIPKSSPNVIELGSFVKKQGFCSPELCGKMISYAEAYAQEHGKISKYPPAELVVLESRPLEGVELKGS